MLTEQEIAFAIESGKMERLTAEKQKETAEKAMDCERRWAKVEVECAVEVKEIWD